MPGLNANINNHISQYKSTTYIVLKITNLPPDVKVITFQTVFTFSGEYFPTLSDRYKNELIEIFSGDPGKIENGVIHSDLCPGCRP
jgi:hypothetical protein